MGKWQLPPSGGHMDKQTGLYMQNMTGKQIQERLKTNDLIIVPLGSTENHGPHGPNGEDTFSSRMAELVAERTGCTIAQPIWYGSHPSITSACPRRSSSPKRPSSTMCVR